MSNNIIHLHIEAFYFTITSIIFTLVLRIISSNLYNDIS